MYHRRALPRPALFIPAVLVAVVAVAIGGCYDPRIQPCTVTCSSAADCSSGQSCSGGVCQRPGDSCPDRDADIDAPDTDAAPGDGDDPDAPPGATWRELSTGDHHACAIASTGVLYCWGHNDYQQLGRTAPSRSGAPLRVDAGAPTTDWEHVSVGPRHSCATRMDGTLWCWGLNFDGQCGVASGAYAAPSRVNDPGGLTGTRWTAVAAGLTFTCALRDDGSLWCFGRGDAGQIGQGVASTSSVTPLRVGSRTDWRTIEAGFSHLCGIYGSIGTRGQVACWGYEGGQSRIGDGANMDRYQPTDVTDDGVIDWKRVSVGDYSACAIEASGQLWCWGDRFHIPGGTTSPIPTRLPNSTGIDRVSMGAFGGCLVDNGIASCFGYNAEGAIGSSPVVAMGTPTVVAGLFGAAEIRAGASFTCALDVAGAIHCWGDRGNGALGDGIVGDARQPVEVLGQHHPWLTVEAGVEHTCGVTMAGVVYCWGSNYSGQLGGGLTVTGVLYETPILTPVTGTGQHVSQGYAHGCARTTTGELSCWGNNDYGQRGVNAGSPYEPTVVDAVALSELATGFHSNCGITSAGQRRCWGANDSAQLGDGGTSTMVSMPTTISETPTSWSKITMGDAFGCGLAAGALHCWGQNNVGQTGQPASMSPVLVPTAVADPTPGTTDSWIDLSAGASHACGVLSTNGTSGTLYCWGYNGRGQLGSQRSDGPTLTSVPGATNFIEVSAGYGHTCGVRATGELHCWGSNDSGELGDGSLVNHTSIGLAIGAADWHTVAAGQYLTCGIRGAERRLFCWGENLYGQAGIGGALRWMPATVPVPP